MERAWPEEEGARQWLRRCRGCVLGTSLGAVRTQWHTRKFGAGWGKGSCGEGWNCMKGNQCAKEEAEKVNQSPWEPSPTLISHMCTGCTTHGLRRLPLSTSP